MFNNIPYLHEPIDSKMGTRVVAVNMDKGKQLGVRPPEGSSGRLTAAGTSGFRRQLPAPRARLVDTLSHGGDRGLLRTSNPQALRLSGGQRQAWTPLPDIRDIG